MKQTFNLVFDNYIEDKEFDKLPYYSGIYLFRVTIILSDKHLSSNVVYVGKADQENGLNGRVNEQHDHLSDARKLVEKEVKDGKHAILTIAYTNKNPDLEKNDWIDRAEAALINAAQPMLNIKSMKSFDYDETELNISGSHHQDLDDHYDVTKKEKSE